MEYASPAPIVSFIVRTKDRPRLLERALKSLAAQTYSPIEVVLINDGGAALDVDALGALLGDLTLNYHWLQTNRGRAHAANVGISLARGRFIGFLDDDDELYPEHVDVVVPILLQGDFHVAYSNVEMVVQAYSDESRSFVDLHKSVFDGDFSYARLLIANYIPLNAVLFDAEVLRAVQGVDEAFELYEDWDLLIRIAKTQPFAHLNRVTARYNQWSEVLQINRSNADQMSASSLRIIRKHRAAITPEVILEYRGFRDAHDGVLRETIAQDAIRIGQFETELSQLDGILTHRTERVRQLEALATERNERIKQLDQDLRQAHVHFDGVLDDRDRQLTELNRTIDTMRASLGWRALERMRGARDRLLPAGSLRRRSFDLGLRSLMVLRHEGWGSAARKAVRRAVGLCARGIELARMARSVYRSDGAAAVIARGRTYLRRSTLRTAIGAEAVRRTTDERYRLWILRHEVRDEVSLQHAMEGFAQLPTVSIITPVYNVDPQWLDRCIESVLAQRYMHWELCLHDDASTREDTRRALRRWEGVDDRISISMGRTNEGISAASNVALERACGDFVALLDHDDELSPDALFEVVKLLNEYPDTDLVYSDEDRISEGADGATVRHDPFFKPDWSPQLLFACMYTGHLSVYRKRLVEELGGFRSEFDFSQDYDLALRVTEKTDRIRHLPKVLYHWRTLPESAAGGGKAFARESNIAALQAACDRRSYNAKALALPHANRVLFRAPAEPPLVSIIIPTDSRKNIFNCIDLVLRHTDYRTFEVVVVTNTPLGNEITARYADDSRIRIVPFDRPFNFSLKCNEGAAAAHGEYILFYNDDVEAIDRAWLADMVSVFGKGNVGGVSPKLFYENDTIQYAGMITGVRGMVGTAFHTAHKDSGTYFNLIQSERDVSLLSGACLLMPKRVFDEIGGFDAINTPIMHSDIDLCCRIRDRGYDMVYTPFASLRHIGHLSLKETDHEPERKKDKADLYVFKRWGEYLSRDPYYPENMIELLYHQGNLPYQMSAARQEAHLLDAKDLLLISHDLTLSGAPILLVYLAEHFRAKGFFVTVMSPLGGELALTLRNRNIPVVIDATLATVPDQQTCKFMAAFDLVVANTIVAWPSVLAAKASATPVLWLLHESHDGRRMVDEERQIAQALAAADEVVFACMATRSLYEDFNRSGNFRVIPYGARPLEVSAQVSRANDRVRIVHIGSIERRKGQDVLLDSLARLSPECSAQLEVVMIGRRLKPDFYDSIEPALRATAFVQYVGQKPHAEIAEHLAAADIFVSSSRDEVFPVTILEAMSLGKPVIATAVGGVPEMLRDGVDGIVVPPEDSAALAEAITRLIGSAQTRQAMGESGRQRFFHLYTVDKLGDRLLELIDQRL